MSILNCSTRLSIVNHTGLPATFTFTPKQPMRLQPLGQAHASGSISSQANSVGEWIQEFFQLVTYGPTYDKLEWVVGPGREETVRFNLDGPLEFSVEWTDPSVSWERKESGKWSFDISKTVQVTLHLRADTGEYIHERTLAGPASVKSVHLKQYLEVACDEDIPFSVLIHPVSRMFWRKGINLRGLVDCA